MRSFILATTLCLLTALPLQAAGDRLNTLSPEEIADGWILLFDGETTFGWNNGARWTVSLGMLAPQAENKLPLVTTTGFGEYQMKLQYLMKRDSKPQVLIGCGPDGSPSDQSHAVQLKTYSGEDWWELDLKVSGGSVEERFRRGNQTSTTIAAKDPKKQSKDTGRGHIALSGSGVIFRSIKLKPLNTKSLFNGKDLTGWKEFPGRKSKFTVTTEGWLNIQNGPGDLQTEGQWADFVLQLDCKSNGKHLNSGVFFRCRPGEYQQGYEAQIHNGFDEQKPKEYVLEEYDPKTHELKDKKKVKYAALDYGTGAIYRRQPARRQMAQDHEWFTMTVVAEGRHMAVWVNGIQVTDWTDNRPLKDNARNGCRLEKGPISLQGHDPTTDLSFRNFRIAELTPR